MANVTLRQFTAGIMAAALAFKHQMEAEKEKASLSDTPIPEERDEEELWEFFQSFISDNGIADRPDPDLTCIAGLSEGEPSFTLRGQDVLASMLVRHWISLYDGLAPDANSDKIDGADIIAEKMEHYRKQKWAD